jgi:hypothetical protein
MDMAENREKTIEELFDEGTPIDEALRRAVREALLRHKKLGNPIAVWEDSRVVWIPPEEIEPDDVGVEEDPRTADA